jgi:hypothetical protein
MAPPPAATAASCTGAAKVADEANVRFLPKRVAEFCLDPAASDRGFGEGAQEPLGAICELFDGECEIYKRYGVKRVIEARYVDGSGSGATINLYLSTFGTPIEAYAMFTKRTVGDGDPAMSDAARPLAAGGGAALGIGNAYLWRGKFLAEMTYNDSAVDVKALQARADIRLAPLAKSLGQALPGDLALPAAAAALPKVNRVALGVRYLMREPLGIRGAGHAAYGYYRDGATRWRLLITAADEADGKQTFAAFAKSKHAKPVSPVIGKQTLAMSVDLAKPARGRISKWLLARCRGRVIGIGDEWLSVMKRGPSGKHATLLSDAAKRAKLEALCQTGG